MSTRLKDLTCGRLCSAVMRPGLRDGQKFLVCGGKKQKNTSSCLWDFPFKHEGCGFRGRQTKVKLFKSPTQSLLVGGMSRDAQGINLNNISSAASRGACTELGSSTASSHGGDVRLEKENHPASSCFFSCPFLIVLVQTVSVLVCKTSIFPGGSLTMPVQHNLQLPRQNPLCLRRRGFQQEAMPHTEGIPNTATGSDAVNTVWLYCLSTQTVLSVALPGCQRPFFFFFKRTNIPPAVSGT